MKTPVVGDYVNFTVQKIHADPSGARIYVQQKYSGKVTAITERDMSPSYKIYSNGEYYEVRRFKITHVWHTV